MSNNTPTGINTKYIQEILDKEAKKLQILQWDIGASCSHDNSVQVDKGKAKQMKSSQKSAITIRSWNRNGLIGITSTTDLSPNGLSKAISRAFEASNFGNQNELTKFSKLAKEPLIDAHRDYQNLTGIQALYLKLREAEEKLIKSHKDIKTVPYNGLSESTYHRFYINSEGAFRQVHRSQCSIYLYARAQENNRKPRSSGAIRLATGIKDLNIIDCIQEASNKTISHLNYYSITTGKYLICFTPEAFLELVNAFMNIFNARSIIDGVSLSSKDSIGSKIASDLLTIYDDGAHPSNISPSNFDGEGTPTKKICLLRQGIIENFMHSEATARDFGVEPTGHAGMGAKVGVGSDWLVISRDSNKENLIQSLNHKNYQGKYILIDGLNALHSGIKASQGSFSLPFDGWLIENGISRSIEAATIAGDINVLLASIIEVEKEQFNTHIGTCPHIWVDGLSITGEA